MVSVGIDVVMLDGATHHLGHVPTCDIVLDLKAMLAGKIGVPTMELIFAVPECDTDLKNTWTVEHVCSMVESVATSGALLPESKTITIFCSRQESSYWKSFITHGKKGAKFYDTVKQGVSNKGQTGRGYFRIQQTPLSNAFPEPSGLYVNMMPFVMGDLSTVPEECRGYHALLEACPVNEEELGKIGYLTIDERPVTLGKSQRRPGVHTESPGVCWMRGLTVEISDDDQSEDDEEETNEEKDGSVKPYHCYISKAENKKRFLKEGGSMRDLRWGGGGIAGSYQGGIYMASTVSDSLVEEFCDKQH